MGWLGAAQPPAGLSAGQLLVCLYLLGIWPVMLIYSDVLMRHLGASAAVCPSLWLLLGPGGMVHVELHGLFLQQLLMIIF